MRQKNDIVPQKHSEVKWLTTNHTDSDSIFRIVTWSKSLKWRYPEFTPGQHLATSLNWNLGPPFLWGWTLPIQNQEYPHSGVSKSSFLGLWRGATWFCGALGSFFLVKHLWYKPRWEVWMWGWGAASYRFPFQWISLTPCFILRPPLIFNIW